MSDEKKSREKPAEEVATLTAKVAGLLKEKSEWQEQEKSLTANVELCRALFDHASDAVFVLEAQEGEALVIVDANIAACKMHGYSKEELIGMPIKELDAPETSKHVKKRAKQLLAGKKIQFEGEHVRKDGSLFPVEVTARKVVVGDKTYILAIDRNITRRKLVEEEKETLIKELKTALKEVKALKVMIPVCAVKRKDQKIALRQHYDGIKKDGKCHECLRLMSE